MLKHNTRLDSPEIYWSPFIEGYDSIFAGENGDYNLYTDANPSLVGVHAIRSNQYGSFVRVVHAYSTYVATAGTARGTMLNSGFMEWVTTLSGYCDGIDFYFSGVAKPVNNATTILVATHGFVEQSDFNDDFKRWYMARFSGTNSATYFGTQRLQSVTWARFYDVLGSYMDGTRTIATYTWHGAALETDRDATHTATLVYLATRAGYPMKISQIVLYGTVSGLTNGYGYNAVATIPVYAKEVLIGPGESYEATIYVDF
jgi:hypothetical protein